MITVIIFVATSLGTLVYLQLRNKRYEAGLINKFRDFNAHVASGNNQCIYTELLINYFREQDIRRLMSMKQFNETEIYKIKSRFRKL